MRIAGVLMLVGLLCANTYVAADETDGLPGLTVARGPVTKPADAGEKPSKADSPFPEFEEVTKDMVADKGPYDNGMFTLWSYPPDAKGKDKDTEKLLCQIPAGFLGEKFVLSTSFSGGGFFTGFPIDERVVQWEVLDRQVLLVEPETRFIVEKSKEVADVVARTYPDRIRVAVPIVTKSPGGDPVIDFGALLKSEFADIGWMALGEGRIDTGLSKWTKKKPFENNVEIGVELAVARRQPAGSYDKKIVHYSFWKLLKSEYRPRVADDRVGYFLTTNRDWAKPSDSRDIFNRYVDRWHLVKRDPSLELCEPEKPIVFYIEKTVPVRFRRAVRDGILEWNKAYQKIGFLNAIEVRQQTDDPYFGWANLDPEDMNFSFFRWIVTGAGFAMGPHRSNPFTGQIYDADIIFDDAMVRYFEQSASQMLPAAAMSMKARDPAMQAFLDRFPQWKRADPDWETITIGDDAENDVREAMRHRMLHRGEHLCEYADGMKHQMAFSHALLAGQPKEVIDRFLYDVIKEVVMHEVGHTLGLRHNFAASTVFGVEEIQRRRSSGEPTTGSVMDYNPVLFFAKTAVDGHFISPTIGPYDYWAIEYGYRPFDSKYEGAQSDAVDEKEAEEAEESAPEDATNSADSGAEPGAAKPSESTVDEKNVDAGDADKKAENGKSEKLARKPIREEEEMLRDIAARSTRPDLVYATDEDASFFSPDPRVNRFDMGSDPIDWAETRMELIDSRMTDILDWAVKDEESWYHLRQAFQSLMFEKLAVLDYVGRYIGGQYFNRAHRGDADAAAPFVLVDPGLQRRALEFTAKHLYDDGFFQISPDVLNHLAPPRWWHEGTSISYSMDYPVHGMIALFQWWNLFDRLLPNTLRRIHDGELKVDAPAKFTLAEYLQSLRNACWSPATDLDRLSHGNWTDAEPFVSGVRRSLQREYLGLMEPLVRWAPGTVISPDIHAMLKHLLRGLADDLDAAIKTGKADFASQAHLTSCKMRIEQMLAPELQEYEF